MTQKRNDNVEIKIDEIVEDPEFVEGQTQAETSAEQDSNDPKIEDAPKPKTELQQAQELADEYKNLAQRVQAEFENFKKRNIDLYKNAYADGKNDAVESVLPAVDNLERALNAMSNGKDKDGVALILKQMNDILKGMGVFEIEAAGKAFDPKLHNAVMREEREGVEEGMVLEVFQKGYQSKNKVIRHSLVKVSG